jgi:exodeoxyribonuclease VII large subunit
MSILKTRGDVARPAFASLRQPAQPAATERDGGVVRAARVPESRAPAHVSLAEFLARIGQAVRTVGREWIVAELEAVKAVSSGHIYLDLVGSEADAGGRQQKVASARATIWRSVAPALRARFEAGTGRALAQGMTLLLRVEASFHPQFGLALNVVDIDPAYTLGDMEARLAAIRQRLHELGEADRNRSLAAPADFTRVAVIGPAEAAGLADFKALATRLQDTDLCAFEFFAATFQGKDAEASIVAAFTRVWELNEEARKACGFDRFDVLVLIRGGGARGDLDWLNTLSIVRAAARFPLPVWVGIGHNTDHVLLDEVAHASFDTPSKVIHGIADRIMAAAMDGKSAYEAIIHVARRRVERAQADVNATFTQIAGRAEHVTTRGVEALARESTELGHAARARVLEAQHRLGVEGQVLTQVAGTALAQLSRMVERTFDAIASAATERVGGMARALDVERGRLNQDGAALVESASRNLREWITQILLVGPQKTLARGFAIVRDGSGQPLSTREQAVRQDVLHIEFSDGTLAVKATDEGEKPS